MNFKDYCILINDKVLLDEKKDDKVFWVKIANESLSWLDIANFFYHSQNRDQETFYGMLLETDQKQKAGTVSFPLLKDDRFFGTAPYLMKILTDLTLKVSYELIHGKAYIKDEDIEIEWKENSPLHNVKLSDLSAYARTIILNMIPGIEFQINADITKKKL